jgi:hypothetical protein
MEDAHEPHTYLLLLIDDNRSRGALRDQMELSENPEAST